jgi:hypothetical protein
MKITQNLEISNVKRIVVDRDYAWELHHNYKGEQIWILNSENEVDDTNSLIPKTHFKTCDAMAQFVRDKYDGGKYRLYIPTIDNEDIMKGYTGVQINIDCITSSKRDRIYGSHPEYNLSHDDNIVDKMRLKLDKFRKKTAENKCDKDAFKKFEEYLIRPIPNQSCVTSGSGGGCNNLYGCLENSNKNKNHRRIDIEWIK